MAHVRTFGFLLVFTVLLNAQTSRADYVVDGGFESYGARKAAAAPEVAGSLFDRFASSSGIASFDVLHANQGRVLGMELGEEFGIRVDPRDRVRESKPEALSVSSLGQRIASRLDSYGDGASEQLEQFDLIMRRPEFQINSLGLPGDEASALGRSGVNLVSLGNEAVMQQGSLMDQVNLQPDDLALAQYSGLSAIADPTILVLITFSLVIALIRFPALLA